MVKQAKEAAKVLMYYFSGILAGSIFCLCFIIYCFCRSASKGKISRKKYALKAPLDLGE